MRYLHSCSLFLLVLLIASCNGTKKTDPAKIIISEENQAKKHIPDIDPYYNNTTTINSAYGPNSITRNILQDRNENIWIASYEGVIRYAKNSKADKLESFTNLTNKEGLKQFRAFSLLEDKSGRIWIGTVGAGVYIYDGSSFTHFSTKDGLVNNDVYCIYEDKNGIIWLGTRDGLSRYDGKSFQNFTEEDGLINSDINSIIEDNMGKLWIAARGNACIYDPAFSLNSDKNKLSGKITPFTEIKTPKGMSFTNVRTMIKDRKGNIWLGGQDGLWKFDGYSYEHLTPNFIGNIYEDIKGNLWVSRSDPDNTYNMSLFRYDLSGEQAKPTLIKKEEGQVFGITEDTKGNIWFGTEHGACCYNSGLPAGVGEGKSFNYFKPFTYFNDK